MTNLEKIIRRTRKPVPSPEEIERIISEEESDETVRELFEGWIKRGSLPPETVLKALFEKE